MSEKFSYDFIEIIAAISEGIAILCTIAYFFVLYYFFKFSIFRRDPFYWLLIHLGVTDIIFLMLYIFYGGPNTFASAFSRIPKPVFQLLSFVYNIMVFIGEIVIPVEIPL